MRVVPPRERARDVRREGGTDLTDLAVYTVLFVAPRPGLAPRAPGDPPDARRGHLRRSQGPLTKLGKNRRDRDLGRNLGLKIVCGSIFTIFRMYDAQALWP